MAFEPLTGNGTAGVYDGTEPRVGLQSMNKIRNSFNDHEDRIVDLEADAGDGLTALTGDVTASGGGSQAATIASDAVTNAKLANMAQDRIKGRVTASTGDPQDLTADQVSAILDGASDPFLRTSSGGGSSVRTVGIVIDGGGNVITTGVKGFVSVPFSGTVIKARVLSIDPAVTSGSIVVDVWKDTYANFPPTNADSITAAAPPTLSAASKSEDSTLTGWGTTVTDGDVFGFNVDSVATLTRVSVELTVQT